MGCNTGTEKLTRYIKTVYTPLTDEKVEKIPNTENTLEIIDNLATSKRPGNVSLDSFVILTISQLLIIVKICMH